MLSFICVYYFTRITGVVLFLGDLTCPEQDLGQL